MLSGIPEKKIKIIGNEQKIRSFDEGLDWVSINENETPKFHKNFNYELTGKGKDQGNVASSTSSIYGSNMENEKKEEEIFGSNYKDFTINGNINEHNTDHKIKIHQYTAQKGGHETYIKNLKLKINGKGVEDPPPTDIRISGNLAGKLNEPSTKKIYEGFENKSSDILQNNVYNIINNIKNYFFPTREPFWWLWDPPSTAETEKVASTAETEKVAAAAALRDAIEGLARKKLEEEVSGKAVLTFIGKDQGWGGTGQSYVEVNGIRVYLTPNWTVHTIDFTNTLNIKNQVYEVFMYAPSYSGWEAHIKRANIYIYLPNEFNSQIHAVRLSIGDKSIHNVGYRVAMGNEGFFKD